MAAERQPFEETSSLTGEAIYTTGQHHSFTHGQNYCQSSHSITIALARMSSPVGRKRYCYGFSPNLALWMTV
ncbi:hypothetical protein L204_100009 [Cryptococcus depauperatus]